MSVCSRCALQPKGIECLNVENRVAVDVAKADTLKALVV
jgi:hypothetical protein